MSEFSEIGEVQESENLDHPFTFLKQSKTSPNLLLQDNYRGQTETLFENIYTDAVNALRTFSPDLVPQNPVCLTENGESPGEYVGTLRDIHFLRLQIEEMGEMGMFGSPPNSRLHAQRVLILIHELLHARFNELTGQSDNQKLNDEIPDEEITYAGTVSSVEYEIERIQRNNLNERDEDAFLEVAMNEGFVYHFEKGVVDQEIQRARKQKSSTLRALEAYRDEIEIVTSSPQRTHTSRSPGIQGEVIHRSVQHKNQYYFGRKIVEKLAGGKTPVQVIDAFRGIDVPACRKIGRDTTQFNEIIVNPIKLPQLAQAT